MPTQEELNRAETEREAAAKKAADEREAFEKRKANEASDRDLNERGSIGRGDEAEAAKRRKEAIKADTAKAPKYGSKPVPNTNKRVMALLATLKVAAHQLSEEVERTAPYSSPYDKDGKEGENVHNDNKKAAADLRDAVREVESRFPYEPTVA